MGIRLMRYCTGDRTISEVHTKLKRTHMLCILLCGQWRCPGTNGYTFRVCVFFFSYVMTIQCGAMCCNWTYWVLYYDMHDRIDSMVCGVCIAYAFFGKRSCWMWDMRDVQFLCGAENVVRFQSHRTHHIIVIDFRECS